jgi:hypothetical protein
MGSILAFPPLGEPALRTGPLPTEVLDLVVGERGVESLGTTGCRTVGHGACLDTLRCSWAALGLLRVRLVLDVMAHAIAGVRSTPGVEERTPGQAARLAPPAPGPPGAGGGGASKPGRRAHARDARERSAPPGFPLRAR